jgi:hypothetical protein
MICQERWFNGHGFLWNKKWSEMWPETSPLLTMFRLEIWNIEVFAICIRKNCHWEYVFLSNCLFVLRSSKNIGIFHDHICWPWGTIPVQWIKIKNINRQQPETIGMTSPGLRYAFWLQGAGEAVKCTKWDHQSSGTFGFPNYLSKCLSQVTESEV